MLAVRDLVDLSEEELEIVVRDDGKVVWINDHEGTCIVRVCKIKKLTVQVGDSYPYVFQDLDE